MHTLFKKLKIYLVILTVGASSLFSLSFVDNYFEITKQLDIFATLYRELNMYYVDETNPGILMKKGIDSMLSSLDPYTNYIAESDIEDYRFMTTGQYGGIGSLIRSRDGYVIIAEPYEDSPAQKAGLIAGDKILKVDGKSAKNKTTEELSKILKGQPGTKLTVLIEREGVSEPLEKTLIREEIKIKDVPYFGMVKDSIGYIKLTGFTETASRELIAAFDSLKTTYKPKGIIVDLRGNGGGLLREAVNIVNVFVEKGQEVVSTKGKIKDWDRTHKALNNPKDLEIPLAVLIDRGSASASEIVSGSIQDLDRGIVVGRKSYGKGLVQQTRDLSYNAKLKVTVAKYYTPSGRCIQRIDYSHKNKKGEAAVIPDSLSKDFKTKKGRNVKDAGGIAPDVAVKTEYASNITQSLLVKMHIFDYASEYKRKHPKIAQANKFSLSDAEYGDFITFLKDKEYDYTTRTEDVIKDLIKTAEKETYLDDVQAEIDALKKKLEHNKNEDLITFKDEIKKVLENEIISRYYYQSGRIQNSLAIDDDVNKAIEILNDKKLYASILDGTYKPQNVAVEEDESDEEDEEFYDLIDGIEE